MRRRFRLNTPLRGEVDQHGPNILQVTRIRIIQSMHRPRRAEITSILTSGVTLGQHTTDPLLRQLLARIRQLPTSSDRRPCLSDITIRGPITDEQLAAVALPNASRLMALRVLSAEVLTGASVNALAACVRLRDLTLHVRAAALVHHMLAPLTSNPSAPPANIQPQCITC